MASDPRLTNAAASAAADAVVDRIDAGGAGTIKIYTGTIPTDADTAVTFSATAFGASAPRPCWLRCRDGNRCACDALTYTQPKT